MEIKNALKSLDTKLKYLGFAEAQELLAIAQAHSQLPCKVIDDGCHERAEVVLKLALSAGIDPSLLKRAFVFNTKVGDFLSLRKPLIQPIKEWFQTEREAGRLLTGSKYLSNGSIFVVDDYGALRAELMPTVYLGDAENATWGVGHVAVMVGDYVVDTAFHTPILFGEWQAEMNLPGIIPLLGKIRLLPELHIEALDEFAVRKVSATLQAVLEISLSQKDSRGLAGQNITSLYQVLTEEQKTAFFELLFEEQIKAKGMYSREHWTEVYPGPLISRGENYEEFCAKRRLDIKDFLATSSAKQRLDLALEILKPYKDYERMILGYRVEWFPPPSY